jgi:hypothetical protein
MTPHARIRLAVLALCTSLHAALAAAQAAPASSAPESGADTRVWLRAQSQRGQASNTQQTLSGPVMRRVHDRYLKSFEQPVPERLSDDRPASRNK